MEIGKKNRRIYYLSQLNKSVKNDYSITFYHERNRVFFLEYVHSPVSALKWFKTKINKQLTHIIIYDRRTRDEIGYYLITLNDIY